MMQIFKTYNIYTFLDERKKCVLTTGHVSWAEKMSSLIDYSVVPLAPPQTMHSMEVIILCNCVISGAPRSRAPIDNALYGGDYSMVFSNLWFPSGPIDSILYGGDYSMEFSNLWLPSGTIDDTFNGGDHSM